MNNCFLICCEYPYITGEPFLETEMIYLSRTFDNVYVFPINASEKDSPTRNVPFENVHVYPIGCIFSKLRYPTYIARGLITFDRELKISDRAPKKLLTCLYAKGRSNYVFKKIKSIIESNEFDTSNSLFYSYWFTDQAICAWKLKRYFEKTGERVNAVCRAHRYDLYSERNLIGYLPYQNISMKMLDKVFPCSDDGVTYLTEKYPDFKDKLLTARLGTVDNGERTYTSTKEKIFVTCCSLKPLKRISMFAKAFCKLVQKYGNCRWICIGDGEELDLIKNIISEAEANAYVDMLGRLSNENVIRFYESTDVTYFVNVSTTEGVPVSIMEAMSFGIPIIATDVGGTSEIVSDINGVLLDAHIDENKLFEILENEILIDNSEYLDKRKQARAVWENKASAKINYLKWCKNLIGIE